MDIQSLPESLQKLLRNGMDDQQIHVAVASDLTHESRYGEAWLVATATRLSCYEIENGAATARSAYPLADIKKVKLVNLTGGGFIEVDINGQLHRLINFSNARNSEFARAVEEINAIIEDKPIESSKIEDEKKICENCGLRIPADLNKCPRCTDRGKTFKRILAFSRPYAKLLFLIFVTLVAGTSFGLITPYLSKLFIDVILQPDPKTGVFQNASWIPFAALALLLAYAGQHFFSSLHLRLAGIVGHKTVFDVRAAIYDKLQGLSLAYFDKHQTGAIMARVNQDTRELQYLLVDFIPLSLESLLTLIGVGIFLLILSWQLTLLVLLPIIATIIFFKKIFLKIRTAYRRYYHRRSRLSALVNDSLSGMRVIKAFGQEKEELNKFDVKSGSFKDAGIDFEVKWSLYSPTLQFLIMSGTVLVWLVGGRFVVAGKMSLGDVVAYAGYLMMFYRPIFMIIRMAEGITAHSAQQNAFSM